LAMGIAGTEVKIMMFLLVVNCNLWICPLGAPCQLTL
jgi:hypothetical protein